jgi:hypothetical protein
VAGEEPDADINDLTLEVQVMVPVAKASFGVGGEAQEPTEVDIGGE